MKLHDIKIYLIDMNKEMCNSWAYYFGKFDNVYNCYGYLQSMLQNNEEIIECIVSPANSFGLMDGGYDLAISEWYRWRNISLVQDKIKTEWYGEQNVGSSLLVDTKLYPKYIIHTPTMTVPSIIEDKQVIYNCMRSVLITALKNNIKSIVIPAFGGGCGRVPYKIIAEQMFLAYEQIDDYINNNNDLTWKYANEVYNHRIYKGVIVCK